MPLTNPSNDPALDPLTSPCSHGATDQPPAANACGASAPKGGGSGGGSAKSSAGGIPIPHIPGKVPKVNCSFGNLLNSLLGKPKQIVTGAKQSVTAPSVTNTGYLLVIVVIGGLLLMIAWTKRG